MSRMKRRVRRLNLRSQRSDAATPIAKTSSSTKTSSRAGASFSRRDALPVASPFAGRRRNRKDAESQPRVDQYGTRRSASLRGLPRAPGASRPKRSSRNLPFTDGASGLSITDVAQEKRIFGTDGVRGVANVEPVTAETALKLGRAAAHIFTHLNPREHPEGTRPKIVLGKDTRLSGYMLENALVAGITSLGVDVLADRTAPDARRGLHHSLASRRRRHRPLRLTQSVRRQRDQILPARRLQTRRPDRAADRTARLYR